MDKQKDIAINMQNLKSANNDNINKMSALVDTAGRRKGLAVSPTFSNDLDSDFNQLCVLPAVTLGTDTTPEKFEKDLTNIFKCRFKFAEEVKIPESKSADLLFYVHNDDIETFAVSRKKLSIWWYEDVIREQPNRYPKEILDKYGMLL